LQLAKNVGDVAGAPVIGMAGPPLPAAILTDLTVFRIRSDLRAVGFRASTPLALRPAADRLTGVKLGGLEDRSQ
jgi:hypothetical protein